MFTTGSESSDADSVSTAGAVGFEQPPMAMARASANKTITGRMV
jgi:hypothetical protein